MYARYDSKQCIGGFLYHFLRRLFAAFIHQNETCNADYIEQNGEDGTLIVNALVSRLSHFFYSV